MAVNSIERVRISPLAVRSRRPSSSPFDLGIMFVHSQALTTLLWAASGSMNRTVAVYFPVVQGPVGVLSRLEARAYFVSGSISRTVPSILESSEMEAQLY